MARLIAKIIAVAAIAIMLLAAVAVAAVPTLRHIAWGWWNNPDGLPALPQNPQVHYEDGESLYARVVGRLMPAAIARIEATHGRAFAHPVTVGVYGSRDAYLTAIGPGYPGSVGTMFLGRVILSPALFTTKRARLESVLIHELSHAHLRTWISDLAYLALPNWFKEGLAVMVSGGGGAEEVSEAQARAAILRGDHIAVDDHGSPFELISIRMARDPVIPATSFRIEMAYRQAGMLAAFLHDSDPAAFARMMNAILDGRPFAEAVQTSYGADLKALWGRFVEGMKGSESSGDK
jgi:hypothetical protein